MIMTEPKSRSLESFTNEQLNARVRGAYRKIFDIEDHKLIIRDVVAFANLAYHPESVTIEELPFLEGRRQMAMHFLRHLDIDPREIIEYQNDAQIINANTKEDDYE